MILIVAVALGLALAGPGIIIIADGIRTIPHKQFRTLAGALSLGEEPHDRKWLGVRPS